MALGGAASDTRSGLAGISQWALLPMNPATLTLLSGISVLLLHYILKGAFALIEKAHEHLRNADRRNNGGELARGTGSSGS